MLQMHILMNNIAIYRGDIPTFRSNALWRPLDLLMSISTRETCSQRRRSEASRILAAVTIFKNIYFNVTICKVVVMGCLIIGIDILSSKQMKSWRESFHSPSACGTVHHLELSCQYDSDTLKRNVSGFLMILRPNLMRYMKKFWF